MPCNKYPGRDILFKCLLLKHIKNMKPYPHIMRETLEIVFFYIGR